MRTYPAMLLGLALAVTPFAARADDAAPTGDAPAPAGDTAPAQESGVKPASATTVSPAPAAAAETDAAPEMAVELLDDPAAAVLAKKPWSVTIANGFGFGLQADPTTAYNGDMLNASGMYKVAPNVMVGANAGLYFSLDSKPEDTRRIDAGAVALLARHMRLYQDAFTGIRLSGGLTVAQGVGMKQFGLSPAYPTIGASLGLARSVGPVQLSYGFGFNKYNWSSDVNVSTQCVADRGSAELCVGETGGYNPSWQMSNTLSASWAPMDKLTLSGSFGFINGAKMTDSSWESGQQNPIIIDGDIPANETGGFSFALSASYEVMPGLNAGLTFNNGGPWHLYGWDTVNPFFNQTLAGMSVDVSYTF